MGRVLVVIVAVALVVAAAYTIGVLFRYATIRARQRKLAKHAPDLLRFEDLDPQIADHIIAQREQLETGAAIVARLLKDPVLLIPSEYAVPLELWLKNNRKELQ